MVEEEFTVEVCLDVVADGYYADGVPLAERGCLHPRAGELVAPAIVVVEAEVVLQSVGTDDVVLSVVEPEDNATRSVLLPDIGLNRIDTSTSE